MNTYLAFNWHQLKNSPSFDRINSYEFCAGVSIRIGSREFFQDIRLILFCSKNKPEDILKVPEPIGELLTALYI